MEVRSLSNPNNTSRCHTATDQIAKQGGATPRQKLLLSRPWFDHQLFRKLAPHQTGTLAAGRHKMATEKGKIIIARSGQSTDAHAHQLGQSAFRSVLPEDIDWETFAGFPPSVRLAILVGTPSAAAPYVIRVKTPSGVKMMPHRHPEDRVYTVVSGVFYIGLGDQFDNDKLQAYPPGSVIVLPGNTSHYHWAKSGQYEVQVSATGPLGLEYIDAKDDPRNNNVT
jgi:quercetin dioxygenase-like cupin family protein